MCTGSLFQGDFVSVLGPLVVPARGVGVQPRSPRGLPRRAAAGPRREREAVGRRLPRLNLFDVVQLDDAGVEQIARVECRGHQQIEFQREVVGERRRQLGDEDTSACQLQPAAWFACNRDDLAGGVRVPLRWEVANRVRGEVFEANHLFSRHEVEAAEGLKIGCRRRLLRRLLRGERCQGEHHEH